MENPKQFEIRKVDHVRIALSPEVQTLHLSKLSHIELQHEALPEINFEDVTLASDIFGLPVACPVFVSSMTAGHQAGESINLHLAKACEKMGWMMGVGSQRRELADLSAHREWQKIRQQAPNAMFFGNLGLTQLIRTDIAEVQRLVDNLEAEGLFIHTNPLQECLQPEGTPQFAGGLQALEALCSRLSVPVVLKEVGCGFSAKSLERLQSVGLSAVDVSGAGGTHWGRVESRRSSESGLELSTHVFEDWGFSTVDSLLSAIEVAKKIPNNYQIWASGGVRTGLDAIKLIALGARNVGMAQAALVKVMQEIETGQDCLIPWMESVEREMTIALFCMGARDLQSLRQIRPSWRWKEVKDGN